MTDRSREALSCHCEGGALTVTVDTQMLQVTNTIAYLMLIKVMYFCRCIFIKVNVCVSF